MTSEHVIRVDMSNATNDSLERLARALRRATDEHGRPNTFSPGDLAELYCGPPAMTQGRIGNSLTLRVKLWEALGGREGWGSCPAYSDRRWAV